MRRALLSLVCACLAGAAADSVYAPPASCESCHAAIAPGYHHSAMARTFGRLDKLPAIENYADSTVFHAKAKQYYRVTRRGGRVFQERYEQDAAGRKMRALELEATHVIGSGQRSRSYLHLSPSGQLIQLPLSWYTQERRWAMSPGYDQHPNPGFSRAIDAGCLFCHNAYVPNGPEGFAARAVWPQELPSGIDCQRCHGPGADHIRLASLGSKVETVRAAIVNPRKLTPPQQLDVCLQCHLQTTSAPLPHALRRFGKSVFSYRPGEPLRDYIVHFDHAAGHTEKFEVNSAGYRLLQSACYRKSDGKLTCTTCHDTHSGTAASSNGCKQCHSPHAEASRGDCVACHMPRRRAEDAVHVVMTDHRIQRLPPSRDLTAPIEEKIVPYRGDLEIFRTPGLSPTERSLYLGLALVTDGASLERGTALLAEAIARSPEPPIEARIGLARALARQNRFKEARVQCAHALLANPRLSTVRAECAKVLEGLGDPKAALAQYRLALQNAPNLPSAAFGVARLTQDPAEALRLFRFVSQDWPLRAPALAALGDLLASRRDFPAAAEALNQALATDPGFSPAENNLGRLFALQGDLANAMLHLNRALELDGTNVEARFNRAQILQSTRHEAQAIAEYQKLLKLAPAMAEAHYALGAALGDEGRLKEAAAEFREALRLRPNYPEARKNLDLAESLLREKRQ